MPLNLYADLTAFSNRFLSGSGAIDANDQSSIVLCLEEASRRVDGYHGRYYTSLETRHFDGTGVDPRNTDYLTWATRTIYTQSFSFIRIPWCQSATQVALDQDSDRVYETVLNPATDYYLLQEYADNPDLPPFDKFQLDIFNGSVTVLSGRPRLVQIQGTWGFSAATDALAITGTLTDGVTTALTVSSASNDLAIGQTLLIGSEQVYLSAGSGTNWTATRGVNGTTAAAHAAAPLSRYTYTPAAREATLITAGRAWARRKTSFTNMIITPAAGSIEIYKGLDPDVQEMLATDHKRVIV